MPVELKKKERSSVVVTVFDTEPDEALSHQILLPTTVFSYYDEEKNAPLLLSLRLPSGTHLL